MRILLIGLMTSFVVISTGQRTVAQTTPVTPEQAFIRVERIGEVDARSFFVFSTSGGDYAIRHDGHSEVTVKIPRVKRYNFDLKMSGRLERVYFAEYENDLLLAYEASDGSYVMRLEQKTMKARWLTPLKRHNLGPGLIEAGEAHFTSSNLLTKIDLANGSVIWEDADLNKDLSSFEEFGIPSVRSGSVFFDEEQKEKGRTIRSKERRDE